MFRINWHPKYFLLRAIITASLLLVVIGLWNGHFVSDSHNLNPVFAFSTIYLDDEIDGALDRLLVLTTLLGLVISTITWNKVAAKSTTYPLKNQYLANIGFAKFFNPIQRALREGILHTQIYQ